MPSELRVVVVGLSLGIAACEPPPPSLSPDFGHAVRHNMQVHIVGPNQAAPNMDGNRATLRMEQYRAGKTTPVQQPGTTQAPGAPAPQPGASPGAPK